MFIVDKTKMEVDSPSEDDCQNDGPTSFRGFHLPVRLKDSGESKYASQVIKKSNPSSEIRRRERVSCGLGVNISLMTKADLIETGTFKRYVKLVDKILDAVEDVDLKSIKLGEF